MDAGRKWYIRVQSEFTLLGARQAPCDQAVYIWEDPVTHKTCGILVAHVDDFLYGGSVYFYENILPAIRDRFIIGSEEAQNMKYLGLHISQSEHYLKLSNGLYAESLKEITIDDTIDKSRPLTGEEFSSLRTVSGQINWIATQTRPDVAFDNCVIANCTKSATVSDLNKVNKAVRKVRGQDISLLFPTEFELDSCQIVGFCDASLANLPDRASQGGFLIFLVDGKGLNCLVAWQSKRIKRVVNSSLAAECLEAVETAENCIYLQSTLEELLCRPKNSLKISVISDNKSLVNAVHTSTSVESKRLQIDISILREMIQVGHINQFRWIETKYQVANSLTKAGASVDYLLAILKTPLRFDFDSGLFT